MEVLDVIQTKPLPTTTTITITAARDDPGPKGIRTLVRRTVSRLSMNPRRKSTALGLGLVPAEHVTQEHRSSSISSSNSSDDGVHAPAGGAHGADSKLDEDACGYENACGLGYRYQAACQAVIPEVTTATPTSSEELADEYRRLLPEHPLARATCPPSPEVAVGDSRGYYHHYSGLLARAADVFWDRRRRGEGRWARMSGGGAGAAGWEREEIGVSKPLGIHYF